MVKIDDSDLAYRHITCVAVQTLGRANEPHESDANEDGTAHVPFPTWLVVFAIRPVPGHEAVYERIGLVEVHPQHGVETYMANESEEQILTLV